MGKMWWEKVACFLLDVGIIDCLYVGKTHVGIIASFPLAEMPSMWE